MTRASLFVAVAVIGVMLAGCASPAPAPDLPAASSTSAQADPVDVPDDDLAVACAEFPQAYLGLQTVAINSETFAEVSVQSGLTRLALEAAAESTLSGAAFEPFVTEQLSFLDTVDAAALAEDRIALLTAVQEGPSFIEPLTDTCAGQPGW